MNEMLGPLMERHRDQIAALQTAQEEATSVFGSVLAEVAIGESEQSLIAVLDSIEEIIAFAEDREILLDSPSAFPLLRTLINAYFAAQDIDQQDRSLGLLSRLLTQISRQDIDRSTAEEIIRVIGLAQRGVSEESRNFKRFLQLLLSVIDLLVTDAALMRHKSDLIRSLSRILRDNRDRSIVADSLAALVLLRDHLTKTEREELLLSMTEAINTDELEVFRRCLQVIVRFAGHGLGTAYRPRGQEDMLVGQDLRASEESSSDRSEASVATRDEQAVSTIPEQMAQAIIDRLPRPELSVEIVQQLDVLFVLIAPAGSPQRDALMDMIARIVESDNYSQIDSVLRALRPLYPQLRRSEQVRLATGVAGMFSRGDLRYLDLSVSVLDVFVADLSAEDQTPIAQGLVRSLQSGELPRTQTILSLLPASYVGFAPEQRARIFKEWQRFTLSGSKDAFEQGLSCAIAIRSEADRAQRSDVQQETTQGIRKVVETTLHETTDFPLAGFLVDLVVQNAYLQPLLPDCLTTLERFRGEEGRGNHVLELLKFVNNQVKRQPEMYKVAAQAARLLGTYASSHMDIVLGEYAQLLPLGESTLIGEIRSQARSMLVSSQQMPTTMRIVEFILTQEPLREPSLIDDAAKGLCSHSLHDGGEDAFALLMQLYEASGADAPSRETIAVSLRDATEATSTFHELQRVANTFAKTLEMPEFRREEVDKTLAARLVPLLRSADLRTQAAELIHQMCPQLTHGGATVMRASLMNLLEQTDLPFDSYQTVIELMASYPVLQFDLPKACADKMVWYLDQPEMAGEALNLIVGTWGAAPDEFKTQLVAQMQGVIDADTFVYTPERYALLVRLIAYLYHRTERQLPNREEIQLHYTKALIRLSATPETEANFEELIRRDADPLPSVLFPKSRVATSVWLLLTPLVQHMPYSKLKTSVAGWGIPSSMHRSVGQEQLQTVFGRLLPEATSPNQHAQMRRAFVNALGQLADSEDEDVVESGEFILVSFGAYIAELPKQQWHGWRQACERIWLDDSRKGTPDVDRIRSGRVRKELQRQIKRIFDDPSGNPGN